MKPPRFPANQDETPAEGPAPTGKRVRIRSINNVVHLFSSGSREETPEPDAQPSTTNRVLQFGGPSWDPNSPEDGGGSPLEDLAKGHPSRVAQQRRRRGGSPAAAIAATLAWMTASSALIFLNKDIMVDRGWGYPFALTAIGQFSSAGAGWAMGRLGLVRLRPRTSLGTRPRQHALVAACFAASLFLGNAAYLGLSVAFIGILKALAPVATLGASLALGLERMSLPVGLATALIAAGTMLATAQEAASSHFSVLAFAAFATSVGFEALRVVLTERLLAGEGAAPRMSAAEVLVYIGPLTGLMLLAGSVLVEGPHILRRVQGGELAALAPALALASGVSVLVNLFCYWAISATSSTTFKVVGCLKNSVVVALGVAAGDPMTARELQGYGISMLGFGLYTWIKQRA